MATKYLVCFIVFYSGSNNCMATLTAGHDPTALDSYLTTLAGQVYSIDEQCRIKKDNSSSFFCRVRQ